MSMKKSQQSPWQLQAHASSDRLGLIEFGRRTIALERLQVRAKVGTAEDTAEIYRHLAWLQPHPTSAYLKKVEDGRLHWLWRKMEHHVLDSHSRHLSLPDRALSHRMATTTKVLQAATVHLLLQPSQLDPLVLALRRPCSLRLPISRDHPFTMAVELQLGDCQSRLPLYHMLEGLMDHLINRRTIVLDRRTLAASWRAQQAPSFPTEEESLMQSWTGVDAHGIRVPMPVMSLALPLAA